MNKIRGFFSRKKAGVLTESEFPELNEAEEREVLDALGVHAENAHAKDVIFGTLTRLKALKLDAEGLSTDEEDDEEDGFCDVGTVRIKGDHGAEAVGTVRIKEGLGYGTVKFYGTVRVKDDGSEAIESGGDVPAWLNARSIRIDREEVDAALGVGSVRIVNPTLNEAQDSDMPAWMNYKPPEDWEVNILALEKGEWTPEMNKNADAFRKYKKDRKQIGTLSRNLFSPEPMRRSRANAHASNSAPILKVKPLEGVEEAVSGGSKLKYTVSPRGISKSKSETGFEKKLRNSDSGGSVGRSAMKRNTHEESSEGSPGTPGRSPKGKTKEKKK